MFHGVGGDGESVCLCVLCVFVGGMAARKNYFPKYTLKNLALRNSGEQPVLECPYGLGL